MARDSVRPLEAEGNLAAYLSFCAQEAPQTEVPYAPPMLSLPYGTTCNALCNFCLRQTAPETLPSSELLCEVYKALEGAVCMASSLYLSDWGEISVSPSMAWVNEYLDRLASRTASIGFATNGIVLHNRIKMLLSGRHPAFVIVSINANDRGAYRTVMGFDGFERVVSNIDRLLRCRARLVEPDRLAIYASMVVTSNNYSDMAAFVRLAGTLGVQGVLLEEFIDFEDEGSELALEPPYEPIHEAYCQASAEAESFRMPLVNVSGSWYLSEPRDRDDIVWCEEPWRSFRVGADGTVYPCCHMKIPLGNVLDEPPDRIWNGEAYRQLRRDWMLGEPNGACRRCISRWLRQ